MTAEQIAELRKLAADAQQEPSSPFVNELGEALEKSLDERDDQWNAALLALGRRWQAWMMIYTPEELHDLRKEIYALWRRDGLGDDRSQQPENAAVSDAITAGLKP